MEQKAEIYCPHCKWRPQPEDRWSCTPSCGTMWNTFWTRAVCPGCAVKWPQTQCFACERYSPHEKWYHYPPEASEEQGEREVEKSEA